MKPIRFTSRRLMFSVAVVGFMGLPTKWLMLSVAYRQKAHAHRQSIRYFISWGHVPMEPGWDSHNKWAGEMANKYARAARYPWLPVAPDPPEPKDAP